MSKLLLAFSVAALLYGDCALGMNSDEIDQESTADYSSQNWPFKSEKKETRLERQKRQLRQLNAELKRNQLATDSKNLEEKTEKREITPKEDLSEKSNFPPNKQQSDLINLQREKIAKYESALQKLNQQLNEEREKNKKAEAREREQKIKIEKLMKLLDDVKSKIKTNKVIEKNPVSDSKQTSNSEQKEFKFKNFDTQHPETLFNIGSSTESRKMAQSKRRIHKKATEYQPNFVFSEKNEKVQKSPQEQLFNAITKGNLSEVKDAIKNGNDVNAKNNLGIPPLFVAVYSKNLEIIKYLVQHGADINQTINNGYTPLCTAIQMGYLEIVEYLVQHGADINEETEKGDTPLHLAIDRNHMSIIELLVEHGANINKTTKRGTTPLMIAMKNGHLESIKYLVEQGADINKDNPLIEAIYLRRLKTVERLEIVKCLVEHGADVNKDNPLGAAISMGCLEIVKCLVEHGANIHTANCLREAVRGNHLEIVKYLVENGADINAQNYEGTTPLQIATTEEIIEYLKSKGAVPSPRKIAQPKSILNRK